MTALGAMEIWHIYVLATLNVAVDITGTPPLFVPVLEDVYALLLVGAVSVQWEGMVVFANKCANRKSALFLNAVQMTLGRKAVAANAFLILLLHNLFH